LAKQLQEGYAPATLSRLRYALRPFYAFLSERDVLAVTPEDVQDYLAGVWREFENPYQRFSRVKALKVFYGWLQRTGLVPTNPTAGVKTPRTPDQVPYVLTVADVQALRKACRIDTFEGLRNRTMLDVAFDCGLRSGELRGLRVADLDWQERTLRVTGKARPGRVPPVRLVPFSVLVTRSLHAYLREREKLPGDVVFVDRQGLPLTRRNIVLIMERLRVRTKLKTARGSWHDLRHAFVTEMLRSGADAEHLRRMLGHKDQRMLGRYAHLLTTDLVRHHDVHSPADRLLRD
jgi:site-specific recombinase XerD